MTREDTEKPIQRLHDVDLVERTGTQGNRILPPAQLLGYIDDLEDSTYALLNIT